MCGFIFCHYYNYDTRPYANHAAEQIGFTHQISGNCYSWLMSDSEYEYIFMNNNRLGFETRM